MKFIATFGYILSAHAINRLYDRHSYLFKDPAATGKIKFNSAYAVLNDSIENKSIKNDTEYMVFLHEKYGYDKNFHFFINGDVLFVGIDDGENKIITTTMSCSNSKIKMVNALNNSNRFKK
jgi:hypothetical protein